jgi:protein disulfide-isomerase
MDFTGSDWCGWCIKLKNEVFNTPEFKAWAAKKVVLLELDFPRKAEQSAELKKQNQELAQKFNIEGYPTIIFADANGKQLGQYGYDEGGPAVWTKKADEFLKKK